MFRRLKGGLFLELKLSQLIILILKFILLYLYNAVLATFKRQTYSDWQFSASNRI